jgi:hypothetical protein
MTKEIGSESMMARMTAELEANRADHEANRADHEANRADHEANRADHEAMMARMTAEYEANRIDHEANRAEHESMMARMTAGFEANRIDHEANRAEHEVMMARLDGLDRAMVKLGVEFEQHRHDTKVLADGILGLVRKTEVLEQADAALDCRVTRLEIRGPRTPRRDRLPG